MRQGGIWGALVQLLFELFFKAPACSRVTSAPLSCASVSSNSARSFTVHSQPCVTPSIYGAVTPVTHLPSLWWKNAKVRPEQCGITRSFKWMKCVKCVLHSFPGFSSVFPSERVRKPGASCPPSPSHSLPHSTFVFASTSRGSNKTSARYYDECAGLPSVKGDTWNPRGRLNEWENNDRGF